MSPTNLQHILKRNLSPSQHVRVQPTSHGLIAQVSNAEGVDWWEGEIRKLEDGSGFFCRAQAPTWSKSVLVQVTASDDPLPSWDKAAEWLLERLPKA